MSTGSKWPSGLLQFYDKETSETSFPVADVVFEEEFLGGCGATPLLADGSAASGNPWTVLIVGDATVAYIADAANGQLRLHIHATEEDEDAVLSFNDQLGLSVAEGGFIEFGAILTTLPTSAVSVVMGLAGPHNLDKDTVANHAWFRWQGDGELLCETDDTTDNNDDAETDITTVAGAYHVYRIDFTDLTDVRFYVDGDRVATGTTFDMSDLAAGEKIMQPYASLDKTNDTGVGDLDLDYIRFWGPRG